MNTTPQGQTPSSPVDQIDPNALAFQSSQVAQDIKRLGEIVSKAGGPQVFFPLILSSLPSDEARVALIGQIKNVLTLLGIESPQAAKSSNESKTKAVRSHLKI